MSSSNGTRPKPRTGYATVFASAEASAADVRPLLIDALRGLGAYPVGAPERHVLDSDDAIATLERSFGGEVPLELRDALLNGKLVLWTMEGQELR